MHSAFAKSKFGLTNIHRLQTINSLLPGDARCFWRWMGNISSDDHEVILQNWCRLQLMVCAIQLSIDLKQNVGHGAAVATLLLDGKLLDALS